jgi:PPOX class probable F420-dependent enzyme
VASFGDPRVRDFLAHGTRTGKLAFLAADGRPLVAPVWFIVEDDSLVFNTNSQTAKGRALARDPRVSVCVDLEAPPYAFVQVQGQAELSETRPSCSAPPLRSRRGTWVPNGPGISASATGCPASWWSGCARLRCSPTSTLPADHDL